MAPEADASEGVDQDGGQREAPGPVGARATQPVVPAPSGANMRQDTFSLDEGLVVLQWPAQLSKTSYADLKDWMELQLRKIGRGVQSAED